MKKNIQILIFFLFISSKHYAIDIDSAKNKISGKWYIYPIYVTQSCGIPLDGDYICKEPLSMCDSFIVFNDYFYETDRHITGKYTFEKILTTDSITENDIYMNLDSTQYDITINKESIDLVRYYWKYISHLKFEYHYILSRKKWAKN